MAQFDLFDGDDLDRHFIVSLDELRNIYEAGYKECLNKSNEYKCFFSGTEIIKDIITGYDRLKREYVMRRIEEPHKFSYLAERMREDGEAWERFEQERIGRWVSPPEGWLD